MLQTVTCTGSPYEIGHTHGSSLAKKIRGSVEFYGWLFQKYTKNSWQQILPTAALYAAHIEQTWPDYHEEMRGIADGSGHDILDIVALNVRTEIAFGLFNDGCTAVLWQSPTKSYLGQNWDWMEPQKENLALLTIDRPGKPVIKMVTEAGIIGKIGLNSCGVGVCLNAIKGKCLDSTKIPTHLGLRMALDSTSVEAAVDALESHGMAASAHILIADADHAVGLEFTSKTLIRMEPQDGLLIHTNHMLCQHAGLEEIVSDDSRARFKRMNSRARESSETGDSLTLEAFASYFEDHDGFPTSICRAQEGISETASLFNIVMDLKSRRATVKFGRPCKPASIIELDFT